MIRVSVSLLDAFNKYINGHTKRNDEPIFPDAQSFLEYLQGEFKPTPEKEYGLAIDAVIEKPHLYFSDEKQEYIYKGIVIPKDYIEKIIPFFDYDFPFQVKGEELYKIGDTKVLLTARADQLHGTETVEFKTTWSGFSYERYASSIQWKSYNLIFGTDRVKYIVADSYSGGDIRLKNIHQFYLYKTDGHYLEVSNLISQLIDFLQIKNKIKELEVT